MIFLFSRCSILRFVVTANVAAAKMPVTVINVTNGVMWWELSQFMSCDYEATEKTPRSQYQPRIIKFATVS